VSFVYDDGVLVAADRNDRAVWADHRARLELGLVHVTTAPVVAQVSRSPRQAQLRRFMRGREVLAFLPEHAHQVGALLAAAGTDDVVDAHLVFVSAMTGATTIVTADPDDIRRLVANLRRPTRVMVLG